MFSIYISTICEASCIGVGVSPCVLDVPFTTYISYSFGGAWFILAGGGPVNCVFSDVEVTRTKSGRGRRMLPKIYGLVRTTFYGLINGLLSFSCTYYLHRFFTVS